MHCLGNIAFVKPVGVRFPEKASPLTFERTALILRAIRNDPRINWTAGGRGRGKMLGRRGLGVIGKQ